MKIVHITSGHEPHSGRILYKELFSLKTVSNDISYVVPENSNIKKINGINIIGYQINEDINGYLKRFVKLINLYKKVKELCFDVIHCHEPDSLMVGYLLKKKFNCKLIYDSHEYHPEAFAERRPIIFRNITEKVIYWMERFLAKKANYIVTVNELLVEKFKNYHPNVISIPNYPKLEMFNFKEDNIEKDIDFVYVGLLSRIRGISKVIEAARILKEKGKKFNVHFIGLFEPKNYEKEIEMLINDYDLKAEMKFYGYIEHNEIFSILKRAKAGLVLLQPEIHRYTISEPTKLFEYIGNGLPVIANNYPMTRNIVVPYDCGIMVNPTDPVAIANAMAEILKNPEKWHQKGKNGIKAIKEKYNWDICEKRLINLYNELSIRLKTTENHG